MGHQASLYLHGSPNWVQCCAFAGDCSNLGSFSDFTVFVLLGFLIAFLIPPPSHAQGSGSPGGSRQSPTLAAGSRLKIENYLGVPEDPISVFQFSGLEKVPAL